MRLREGLEEGLAAILDHLACQTVAATDRETLQRVARTGCADDELAACLVDVFDVIGEYGQIEVRTGQVESLQAEILDGGFWESRAFTRSSLNELPGRRLDVVRPAVFVSDLDIDDPHDLVPVLRAAMAADAGSLLMIVAKMSDACVNLLTANHRPGFPILAMRTPESARGPEADAMEDLAVLTGARMFRAAAGDRCAQVEPDDLGHSRRGWADLSRFGLIGPGGDARQWQKLGASLEENRRKATDQAARARCGQRIARLTGATAVISVNGLSVPAIEARKDLVRRSERTVRSALQEGAVPGGGLALLDCREALARLLDQPGGQIVRRRSGR
jgi:chaperonin GroEL